LRVLKSHDCGAGHIYEVYNDEAAFKARWEGLFVARVRAETNDMVVTLSKTRCSAKRKYR
jgi:hypothetical protein